MSPGQSNLVDMNIVLEVVSESIIIKRIRSNSVKSS